MITINTLGKKLWKLYVDQKNEFDGNSINVSGLVGKQCRFKSDGNYLFVDESH